MTTGYEKQLGNEVEPEETLRNRHNIQVSSSLSCYDYRQNLAFQSEKALKIYNPLAINGRETKILVHLERFSFEWRKNKTKPITYLLDN